SADRDSLQQAPRQQGSRKAGQPTLRPFARTRSHQLRDQRPQRGRAFVPRQAQAGLRARARGARSLARPDSLRPKGFLMRVQLLFAARGGCSDALFDRLDAEAKLAKAGAPSARVIGLTQVADDVFPLANPLCRPFEAVLELQTPST